MYDDLQKGDVLVTGHGGIYMISQYNEKYVATTLDSDYIGTICYYNEHHDNIVDLALAIGAEEGGIIKVLSRHSIKKSLDII